MLPIVRETTPSHSGVSKALTETSNPKTATNDEAPSFARSNLTVIQLVRREIFKLKEFNEKTNVSSRIDPSLEHRVPNLSPNGIWEALESVGRNDAIQIAFADAVRACLEHLPATMKRSGIELAGRNYYSKSTEFMSALESVGGARELSVKVYVLTACIRHIWFDWDGRLIELDVRYPVPVANEVKYMSLEEAVEYYKHMQDRERRFKRHVRAVSIQTAEDYEVLAVVSQRTNLAARPRFDGWAGRGLTGAVGAMTGCSAGVMPSIRTARRRHRWRCRLRR